MTHLELKKKVLGLIEELNPNSEHLTDDPDIAAKYNEVLNQRMFEIARMKKIPKYLELPVSSGDTITFADLEEESGYEVYQIGRVCNIAHTLKADGTVIKVQETGTAEVDFYVYPERITEKTKDNFEFELTPDALEVMVYGIAGDLLKSDVSAEYGQIYSAQYESMLQRLDSRYHIANTIFIDGGFDI